MKKEKERINQQDFDDIVKFTQEALQEKAKAEKWPRNELMLALADVPKRVRKSMNLGWSFVRGYWDGPVR